MQVTKTKPYQGELRGKTKWRGQVEVSDNEGEWLFTMEVGVIEGKDGDFIGFPSRKTPDGEYMNMVRGSNTFQQFLIEGIKSLKDKPAEPRSGEYEAIEGGF